MVAIVIHTKFAGERTGGRVDVFLYKQKQNADGEAVKDALARRDELVAGRRVEETRVEPVPNFEGSEGAVHARD